MISKEEFREAAEEVAERGTDALSDIKDYFAPLADQTKHLADDAKDKVAPLTDLIAPLFSEVVEKVQDSFEDAREWAEQDVLPKIHELWDDAAESEPVQEATERAAALLAAAKSEIQSAQEELPKLKNKAKKSADKIVKQTRCAAHKATKETKKTLRDAEKAAAVALKQEQKELSKGSKGHKLLKCLGLIALLTAIGFALKQFLSPKDDGWTPQQPSAPYHPRNVMSDLEAEDVVEEAESIVDEAADAVSDAVETVVDVAEDVAEAVEDHVEDAVEAVGEAVSPVVEAVEEKIDEAADVVEEIVEEVAGKDPFRFGEGSFVGENPPETFTIKGNERSMKYHTPESAGYDRTITDVWFSSEEAAEAAGFVRAQR